MVAMMLITTSTILNFVSAQTDVPDRSVEHVFTQGIAQIQIDAKKRAGYTNYKFCLERDPDKVRNMNPNNQRLSIALQWLNQEHQYDSLVFKLKVPVLSRHYPFIMEIKKGQSWYDHQQIPPEQYVKEILIGNYNSDEEPNVDKDTAYASLDRNLNRLELNKRERVCVDFTQKQLEPEGYNKLWMAWSFYDDSNTCNNYKYCLSYFRAEGSQEPIIYFNGKEFFDEFDSELVMICYWTMTAFSFLPFIGPPFVALIGFIVQFYVTFVAILQLGNVTAAQLDVYFPEQVELYSLDHWINDSLFFWTIGSWFFTNLFFWLSFVPVGGPICQILLNFWFQEIIFD